MAGRTVGVHFNSTFASGESHASVPRHTVCHDGTGPNRAEIIWLSLVVATSIAQFVSLGRNSNSSGNVCAGNP